MKTINIFGQSIIKRVPMLMATALFISGFFIANLAIAESVINITSPAGGEYWNGTKEITWTSNGIAGDVEISYSINDFNASTIVVIATTGNDGSYFWDTTGASVGDHGNYKIMIKDVSTSAQGVSSAFTVDNTNPTFTVVNDVDAGPVKTDTINITTADATSGVASQEYGFSNDDTCDVSDIYGNSFTSGGDFDITGDNTDHLCVVATDNAGNVAYELVGQLNTDNTVPTIESWLLNGQESNVYFDPNDPASVNIVLNASENIKFNRIGIMNSSDAEVKFFTENTAFLSTANKDWDGKNTSAVVVPDGPYSLRVIIVDEAGNENTVNLTNYTINVDSVDPTLTISSPIDDEVVKNANGEVIFTFASSDNNLITCSYQVNNEGFTDLPNCNSPQTLTLADGRQTITLKVVDGSGNFATDGVDFVVDTNNTLTVDDTSANNPDFATIQDAIDVASVGDTIEVAAGTYNENLSIDASYLTLRGPNADINPVTSTRVTEAILDGTGLPTGPGILLDGPSTAEDQTDVIIEGFEIRNFTGTAGIDRPKIGNKTSDNITIRNNYIHTITGQGINFQGSGEAVWVLPIVPGGVVIEDNLITNILGTSKSGIYFYYNRAPETNKNYITGNKIDGTTYGGILLNSTHNTEISTNQITNVQEQGIYLSTQSKNIEISDNIITNANIIEDSDKGGISFKDPATFPGWVSVTGNTISGSFNGVSIRDGYDITGILITVNNNNLSGNSNAGVYNGGSIGGELDATQNWWGASSGPGVVGNGTGDKVSVNVDFDPWYIDEAMTTLSSEVSLDNIYVDDGYDAGSCDDDGYVWNLNCFDTIQEGVDAVNTDGTVNVAAGDYTESYSSTLGVKIDKSLSLVGTGLPVIHGTGTTDYKVIQVTADDVIVSGIKTTGASDGIGIYLFGVGSGYTADDIIVENCDISGNNIGLFLAGANRNIIRDNTFTDNTYRSIVIQQDSDNNVVKGNTITMTGGDVEAGIVIGDGSGDNTIGGDSSFDGNSFNLPTTSSIANVPYVIWINSTDTDDVTIKNNTIVGGTRAIQFDGGPGHSGLNTISDNIISNPSFGGIMSNCFGDFVIAGNTITNGVRPMEFWQSGNGGLTITGNTIDGTDFDAVNIGSAGVLTSFTGNIFENIDGKTALAYRLSADASAENNWWGTYTDVESKIVHEVDNSSYGLVDYRPWCTEDTCTATDVVDPTVIVSSTETSPTNASVIPIVITFSENVTDLTAAEVVVINGSKGTLTGSESDYSIDVTPSGDGVVTVNIATSTAWDLAGNYNIAATAFSITFDNTNPTFTVVNDVDAGPVKTDTINITTADATSGVASQEYGFSTDDTCDVSDTYGNSFTSGDDFTIVGNNTDYLCAKATDNAGNIAYELVGQLNTDNTVPIGSITLGTATIYEGDLIQEVTINYDGAMDESSVPTIAFVDASGEITSNSNGTWADSDTWTETFTIVDADEETDPVTVSSSGAKDIAGNLEDSGTSTFEIDTIKPTVEITMDDYELNVGDTATVIFTFSETPAEFTVDDITAPNGNLSGFAVDGGNSKIYTAIFTPTADVEDITNIITAGTAWEDEDGNTGIDDVSLNYEIDTLAPTLNPVVILSNNATSTGRAKVDDVIALTFTSSEVIQNLAVTIDGEVITPTQEPDSNNYTATYIVTESSGNGIVAFTIDFDDIAGNTGSQITSSTNDTTVTVDTIAPVLSEVTSVTNPTNDTTPSYIFNSGEAGAITYTGSCGDGDLSNASGGDNTTTFGILADGTYNDCTIKVTDEIENSSDILDISSFTIDTVLPAIVSKNPLANSIGNAVNENIVVVFNDDMLCDGGTDWASCVTLSSISDTSVSGTASFDSGTMTLTFDPTTDLSTNVKYNVDLSGITDLADNALADINWDFTTITSYSIDLLTGWNIISLPVTPTNWTSISDVLASATDEVESVWTYSAVTGLWYVYSNDGVANDDISSMEAGKGYWIKATSDGTLTGDGQLASFGSSSVGPSVPTGVSIASGWNLIGYYQLPDTTSSPIADALSKISSLWSGSGEDILTYTNQDENQILIKPVDTMNPGKGYWLFANEAGSYTYPSAE